MQLNFSGKRRTPVVLQTEAAECGLACLAMVAAYHGHDIDLASLRRRHALSMQGATLAHIMQVATQLQLGSRPLKVELEALPRVTAPAILHWNLNHFVVLAGMRGSRAIIHDPASGERLLTLAEMSPHYTGVCLELSRLEEFQPQQDRQKVSVLQLLGRLRGMKGTLGQIFSMALALEVLTILAPFFTQLVVDNAVVSADRNLIAVLGIGFLMVALVHVGVTAARSWVLTVLEMRLSAQMITNLFAHLLRLPMSFFEKRHLGDLSSRFESLNAIQRTLTSSFVEALVDGLMAIITLIVMFAYSGTLTAIVCVAAVLYALLRAALYRPLFHAQQEQITHAANQQSSFLETIRGIQSVKLFNRQAHRRTIHENLLVRNFNAEIRTERLDILYRALNGALFGVENIAVIWIAALLVLDAQFTVGMLFAFVSFKTTFVTRIGAFTDKFVELRMLGLHAERVADIALAEPEPVAATEIASTLPADIEFRNVTFRYSSFTPPVLHNLSFRIAAGESVAIVGPSGCGKSTLLKLILGLVAPSEGEILIGGVNIAQLAPAHLDLIGAVMQEDKLFAGSIADNICFFDANSDQARIEDCARLAVIHDDILSMPMGYNTLIGDMGDALSGGQKQRVLLARALYKQPKILALDEATSHLDVDCERGVNEAVQSLALTRIIIAHRPETIAMAGRIIALPNVPDSRARALPRVRTRLPSEGEGLAQQARCNSIHSIR
ncbi:peptidase domain-containing ABC transporter [Peristeroidobacter soli]|uniref:peptidase domain-containing ABC transporter n=1 Tax=Peristeroidobacter soli TaxID=2497877 RepID=UPI00101C0D0E|nr:peptidase domain-containing ABC transporter [Peristeroidobacter soli]